MSNAATITVKAPAGASGEQVIPSRFDSATSELLMAVGLSGERQTIGAMDAIKRYAASDPVVTPPISRVSS